MRSKNIFFAVCFFFPLSIVSWLNGTHVWIMCVCELNIGYIDWPQNYYLYGVCVCVCIAVYYGVLASFGILAFIASLSDVHSLCAHRHVISSIAIFGDELFPRAITFVQWCNRNAFFHFICSFIQNKMKMKAKTQRKKCYRAIFHVLNVHACPIKMVTEGPNRKMNCECMSKWPKAMEMNSMNG